VLVEVDDDGASTPGRDGRSRLVLDADAPPGSCPSSDWRVWLRDETAPSNGFAGAGTELLAGEVVEPVGLVELVEPVRIALAAPAAVVIFCTAGDTCGELSGAARSEADADDRI